MTSPYLQRLFGVLTIFDYWSKRASKASAQNEDPQELWSLGVLMNADHVVVGARC